MADSSDGSLTRISIQFERLVVHARACERGVVRRSWSLTATPSGHSSAHYFGTLCRDRGVVSDSPSASTTVVGSSGSSDSDASGCTLREITVFMPRNPTRVNPTTSPKTIIGSSVERTLRDIIVSLLMQVPLSGRLSLTMPLSIARNSAVSVKRPNRVAHAELATQLSKSLMS
jgi:hypothetical protein